MSDLTDSLHRPLRDIRISVTDRCNFRCIYCMPKEIFGKDYPFLSKESLLSFDEIKRLVDLLQLLGVRKVRLTGGEPLLRANIEQLVAMLADSAALELTMTTNGSLLAPKAHALKAAGLDRITVSLDALDDAIFKAMSDVNYSVERVLDAIEVARQVGLTPLKINMVVKRGVNESQVLPMARAFRGTETIVRYIEYMDVGNTNGWRTDDIVPAREIMDTINAVMPLEPVNANYRGEVAKRLRYRDGGGEIGIIASVTQPFCGDCTRMRLSADGKLYTCLFATEGHDVRTMLREGASDQVILHAITDVWRSRADRYSELRGEASRQPQKKVEMSYIGG